MYPLHVVIFMCQCSNFCFHFFKKERERVREIIMPCLFNLLYRFSEITCVTRTTKIKNFHQYLIIFNDVNMTSS